jgi:hypothetical protein
MHRARALFTPTRRSRPALLLLAFATLSQVAPAETRIYTIDPTQSSITLSGTVISQFGAAPIQQQGTGSLTTDYTGTLVAERTSNSIQFTGGAVDANVNGTWQPLPDASSGSAPADYGARVSFLFGAIVVNFAGRDLVANLTGDVTPVDANGSFSLANSAVNFTSGNIAYRANIGTPTGTESLAGRSGELDGAASLDIQPDGLFERLTLPVMATFNFPIDARTSVSLTLDGQLVATAPLPVLLPGDFNGDGSVDAADYVVWSKGLAGPPDDLNYNIWRANFGRKISGGALDATSSAIPEPASVVTTIVGFAALFWNTRRLRRTT